MAVPEVEEFAKLLMQHVRDKAIGSCDMLLDPSCNSVDAKRWREYQLSGRVDDLLREVIPDCVDTALFYLLKAIDEGILRISFKASSGRTIDLVEAGESEMAGWGAMGGADGWRARFSEERFSDD